MPKLLWIKIGILAIGPENCKIFTTKSFHRNTYSCLFSRICLRFLSKNIYLKNSSTLTGKTLNWSLFKKGLQASSLALCFKNTLAQLFSCFSINKHIFHRTTPGDCFYMSLSKKSLVFPMEILKRKHYFNVVPTRPFFS